MNRIENRDNLIHNRGAEQAIGDGTLVRVDPELSQEAGFRWPVLISQEVASVAAPTQEEQQLGQSLEGRLWGMLWMARVAINAADPSDDAAPFEVMFRNESIGLWVCIDTAGSPAIRIVRSEEYIQKGQNHSSA